MITYALTSLLGIMALLHLHHPTMPENKMEYVDVYILAGQSNMDGLGLIKDLPQELRAVNQEVYIYNPNRRNDQEEIEDHGYWEALRPGHGSGFSIQAGESRYSDKFGIELSFARKMRELHPTQRIALFKYAKGGASIHQDAAGNWGSWTPTYTLGNGINQFDHFAFHLKRAFGLSDVDQDGKKELLRPAGILWLQGESDASYSKDIAGQYKDNLRHLMNEIRALTGVNDLPVVVARISESHMDEDKLLLTYGDIVRQGQKDYTIEDRNAGYIDAPEGHGWLDPWHYDSATYIELGNRFADKMYALKKFVVVKNQQFELSGKPYYVVGTNFWYGPYLGMPGDKGDRSRLTKELDVLKELGITNLRVLAASEGVLHKNALQPSFQPDSSNLNEELFIGLDFLLAEMAKRDMKAVLFVNNFWEWSGGMNQYSEWYGEGKATNPSETGDWTTFMNHSAKFYQNEAAQKRFRFYLKTLITRKNSINGINYDNDPTIMSWQLANEPRPGAGAFGQEQVNAWVKWIDETAAYIKQLAPKHLVSTGNEGTKGSLESMDYFVKAHQSKHIDYLTFHMWAKNWGWYQATNAEATFSSTLDSATKYLYDHIEVAKHLNKPLVMEEFGLGRDQESFNPRSTTTYRDRYYNHVYAIIEESIQKGSPLVGSNFWAWGGYGKANAIDYAWKPGDAFTGDPPQEPQGLNSVFATDSSTLEIIRKHALQLKRYNE